MAKQIMAVGDTGVEMVDQFKQTYKDEVNELLTALEISLLELEDTPDDMVLVCRVFRSMHAIKGSASMFGFDAIADFSHEVEMVFDLVRNGMLAVTSELVNLSRKAKDRISTMLDADGSDHDVAGSDELIAGFRLLAESGETMPRAKSSYTTEVPYEIQKAGTITYRICFKPFPDIFHSGITPVSLLDELRGLGHMRVMSGTTILDDGTVARILDIPVLIQSVELLEKGA